MDLSICIVSWNTRELLRQCLRSIHSSAHDLDVEVVVVDNASTDGSPQMVRQEFPAVRLFANDINAGFAAGSNLAIWNSTGRHILLLNSDTIVMPGTLGIMVQYLDDHSDVGAAGCRLLNPDGSRQLSYRRFPSLTCEYARMILISKAYHHIRSLRRFLEPAVYGGELDSQQSVDWISGACLMARRRVFDEVGLLDERYFMFCEEIDWCYRARKAGWDIRFIPSACIIHYGGESSKQNRLRTYWSNMRSTYRYFRKLHAENRTY